MRGWCCGGPRGRGSPAVPGREVPTGSVPLSLHLHPPSAPRSSARADSAHGGGSADDIKASSSDGFPQLRLCGCTPTHLQHRNCSISLREAIACGYVIAVPRGSPGAVKGFASLFGWKRSFVPVQISSAISTLQCFEMEY